MTFIAGAGKRVDRMRQVSPEIERAALRRPFCFDKEVARLSQIDGGLGG